MEQARKSGRSKPRQAATLVHNLPGLAAVYGDGAPFDRLQYLEAKLILKPDRFTSLQRLRDFGQIVRRTAKQIGIGFIESKKVELRPQIREIIFFDTPNFDLYTNAFILRRRTSYVDGFPEGDPEIVFKFRHPDKQEAAALDVRPRIRGKYRIKFKAEALPLKEEAAHGYRILYSHTCRFGLSQMHQTEKTSMATLHRIFPALERLNLSDVEEVKPVNEGIVEEVLLPLGRLDFGNGALGKCDIALWRTRGEHVSLVGEFAFQFKFDRKEHVAAKQKNLAAQFYIPLQREVLECLALGVTKTAMVYRLKGIRPQSHE
jgi:hypothetical protein